MQGLHLTADLYQCRCDPAWLTDAQQLCDWCVSAAQAVGLQPLAQVSHRHEGGASASVLLAHSHVCVHTWPGQRGVTADVYVSNEGGDQSAKARGLMYALIQRFQPEWTEQRSLDRGGDEA